MIVKQEITGQIDIPEETEDIDEYILKHKNEMKIIKKVVHYEKDTTDYLVEIRYPVLVRYSTKAENPAEAIKAAKNEFYEKVTEPTEATATRINKSGIIDTNTPLGIYIYYSNNTNTPILSITPTKKSFEETLKKIITHIRENYNIHLQLNLLINELNIDPELLKYFGYTEKEITDFLQHPNPF